jgi:hypothetical protein
MRFTPAFLHAVSASAAALLFPLAFAPQLRAQAPAAPVPAASAPAAAEPTTSPAVPRPNAQPDAQPAAQSQAQPGSQAGAPAAPPAKPSATVIDYTGSLLGYYRMEIGESTPAGEAAPTGEVRPTLEPVRQFLAYRASAPGKDRLLLGMGDNFGPEFGASLQMENDTPVGRAMGCYQPAPPNGGEARPESLYKDDDRVALKAQCDNVLNFMMQAGFRALVPGSQDFMYTARWLRASALRLQEAASDPQQSQVMRNRDNRLDMLGANLRIAMKGKGGASGGQDKADGKDESQHSGGPENKGGTGGDPDGPASGKGDHGGGGVPCPLLFAPDPFSAGATRCVNDMSAPDTLDWLDRLDRLSRQSGANPTLMALQELATDSNLQAKGRQSELDSVVGDEVSIMVSAWGRRFAVPQLGGRHGAKGAASASEDLDETEVSNLVAQLAAMPDCRNQNTAGSASGDDRSDLCLYAVRLGHILRCRNILIHQAPRTGPRGQSAAAPGDACPASGASSVDANGAAKRVTGSDLTLTEIERDAARRGLLRTVAAEERNVGYTVATTGDGRRVLVIGVAGQDTMQAVSATNLRLCRAQPANAGGNASGGNASGGDVFGRCGNREAYGSSAGNDKSYTVVVTDPVQVAQAVVRGANLVEGHFDSVVVMAQMPHTEAEVLAQRLSARLRLAGAGQGAQPVDVVLSEAEPGYGSPQLTLTYPDPTQDNYPAPVLTPRNSYASEVTKYVYPGAVSELTLTPVAGNSYTVDNRPSNIFNPPTLNADAKNAAGNTRTTITLLYQLMDCLEQARAQAGAASGAASGGQDSTGESASRQTLDVCLAAPPAPGFYGTDTASSQKAEFALLRDMQEASRYMQQAGRPRRPDVVLLQSRDVELDEMGSGYMGYEMCDKETQDNLHNLCMVRSALDRIFWKGDYVAYVAVTGKDLINILNLSEQKMAEQAELSDTGYTREWLITYGIVQSSLTNVTALSRNNEPLWIPVDPNCKGDSPVQSTYCIGGTAIANDSYYWLLTTDQLAQDKAVYGTLDALSGAQHQPTETFVTAPLAHYLLRTLHGPIAQDVALMPPSAAQPRPGAPTVRNPSAEQMVTYNNEIFQQTRLFQVDFSKIIASFSSRQPVGGNQFVSNFQGVSDSRATAPSQQELDLEAGSRITTNAPSFLAKGHIVPPMSFGVQSTFGYDRSVLGNLLARPINPSFSLNNLTVGAFLQIRLHHQQPGDPVTAVRSIPRSLLVFTPRQYQVQINHQYLFFSTANSSPQAGELTVTLPRNDLWTDRAGFREEFGRNRPTSFFSAGSYFETGVELSSQDNVLASLTLQDGSGAPVTCNVSPKVTLQNCFTAAPLPIIKCKPGVPCANATVQVGPAGVKTLHTPGFYWQLHIQNRLVGKQPGKSFSLVTDSQGDYYTGRPNNLELPTQTEYAIPLSVSVLFPSLGNLSFAPSYSGFFYKSQLSSQSLQVNSFSIAARWYFARDARVPVRRQARLQGPSSADQTKTGKAH